jgi:predicted DCC family thiol-disulfide oxidoreductase YuxK
MTGDSIEYIASQASEVRKRFPEIPQSAYEHSVQLVEPNGAVYHGAEAVLRSRMVARKKWLLWIYYRIPGARILFEWGYSFIASHRVGFSRINRLVFGEKA